MNRIEFENNAVLFYNEHNQLRMKVTSIGYHSYIYETNESKIAFNISFTKDLNALAPLFVISAVSASGKSTLVDSVISKLNLQRLITTTTRAIRETETGNEYHFVSRNEYETLLESHKFIESACVYGNYYGLETNELVKNIDKPRIIILDVKGYNSIKSIYPNTIGIFILPPSRDEIQNRLNERNGDPNEIVTRLAEMDSELLTVDSYNFKVKPDTLECMEEAIISIIQKNSGKL